jgi:hypothetical protein
MLTLKDWADLQTLLGISEQPDLDFKEARSRDNFAVEARKDIAALANTLGGHIIVGASTDKNRSRCTGFHGIEALDATALASEYESHAKACRPAPFVSSHCIDHPDKPGRVVLVIAVGMSPVAPGGAPLQQGLVGGHLVAEGWLFPYRLGSHTRYLSPDQFGAYESMSARRAAALLSGIPLDQRNRLQLRWQQQGAEDAENMVGLEELSLERNVAVFIFNRTHSKVAVPLDEVVTVWCANTTWVIALRGYISSTQKEYWPALAGSR